MDAAREPAAGVGGLVVAVCRGAATTVDLGDRVVSTGIDKRAVTGTVEITAAGLAGDQVMDTENHGGPDQAVYVYGQQDAEHWGRELARPVPPGVFGENLRVAGVEVSEAVIGERWRIGDEVTLEVTSPRIPCRVFAAFLDVPDLITRFLAAGRPGAYLRVLSPGSVAAGDRVTVLSRPDHGLTVAGASRIYTVDRHLAGRFLEVDGVAERLRTWALARAGSP